VLTLENGTYGVAASSSGNEYTQIYCKLSSVTFNTDLVSISDRAFLAPSPSSTILNQDLNLPASVTYLGQGAFANTGITSITSLGSITRLDGYVFMQCASLSGTVTIPSSVTTIVADDSTFYSQTNIASYGPTTIVFSGTQTLRFVNQTKNKI
jgi:hypothetical protein